MIVHDRFQNHVSESIFTLPVCAVVATVMWWWPQQEFALRSVWGWVLCALITYVLMETNSVQHLIRIRTRMMSCVWLMLAASQPYMHPLGNPAICASCLAVSYYLLFKCYQQYEPTVWVYHSFLFLGVGSFCAPLMLLMGILFYIYLGCFLRSFTWKGFWAGILGILTPYWCWLVWCLLTENMDALTDNLLGMWHWDAISWVKLVEMPLSWKLSWLIINVLCLVGMIHYLHTNYNDKIRVRMMLYIYVAQTMLLMTYLALQPSDYQTTMALLLVSGSPLIAHYFSLTGSWLSNAFFVLSLLMCIVMSYLNLWMPSFSI